MEQPSWVAPPSPNPECWPASALRDSELIRSYLFSMNKRPRPPPFLIKDFTPHTHFVTELLQERNIFVVVQAEREFASLLVHYLCSPCPLHLKRCATL